MAHAHRISPMSVHRILAEELKLKSWKPLKRHDLTKKNRDCRKVRAPLLLNRFKNNRHRLLVFSDEKPFCIEQASNAQNDRIRSKEKPPTDQHMISRSLHPEWVHIWACITLVARVVDSWPGLLQACIDAGGYIE
uniref:Transposase n=1 Tax=Acrobeloides nanus TaxID=290746 RepID=A0A914E6C3_9BILA